MNRNRRECDRLKRGQKADGGQSLVSAQTQSGSAGEHRLVF